jgi:hypothetical protein
MNTKDQPHKQYYWWFLMGMNDMKEIENDLKDLTTETLGDWLISRRAESTVERRCYHPFAKCWVSNRRLFLRKAKIVKCVIPGPGEDVIEYFYFVPKHHTLWLMK